VEAHTALSLSATAAGINSRTFSRPVDLEGLARELLVRYGQIVDRSRVALRCAAELRNLVADAPVHPRIDPVGLPPRTAIVRGLGARRHHDEPPHRFRARVR
jgi:hypothetical protein